jgi:uncharacterized protein (DUF427 family)
MNTFSYIVAYESSSGTESVLSGKVVADSILTVQRNLETAHPESSFIHISKIKNDFLSSIGTRKAACAFCND